MPSRRHRTAAAALAFALLLGACSGDDDDAADATTTTAAPGDDDTADASDEPVTATAEEYIEARMQVVTPEELELIGEERSRCINTALVNAVTAERLQEAGVTPEELASPDFSFEDEGLVVEGDQRAQLEADFAACGDALDLFVGFIRNAGAEVSDEQEQCVRDAVSEEAANGYFVDGLFGLDPDPALQDALRSCFPELTG